MKRNALAIASVICGVAVYAVGATTVACSPRSPAEAVKRILLVLALLSVGAIISGHIAKRTATRRSLATVGLVLGYVALAICFVGLAMPHVDAPRVIANEVSAVGNVLTIYRAEQANKENRGTYDCDLHRLQAAGHIDERLATGKKLSYTYSLRDCTNSSFVVIALPDKSAKRPAVRSFCADQTGVIKTSRDGTAENCLKNGQAVRSSRVSL